MFRKILFGLSVLTFSMLNFTGIASASWSFDLIETNDNVYDFVLSTDEEIDFCGGMASFVYEDYDSLSWSYTINSFTGVTGDMMGTAYEQSDGDLTNFNWMSFGTFATVSSDTVLATITFTGDGDANLDFDWDDTTFKMEVNEIVYQITDPELNSVYTSSAVPVPAAAWLLGSGLIGLIGLRRGRK